MKCKRYLPLRDKTVLAFHTNHTKKKRVFVLLRKPELAKPKRKKKRGCSQDPGPTSLSGSRVV
jgi:hypothetical protein